MPPRKKPKKMPANFQGRVPKPYEPTTRDLEWHRKWTIECKSASEIARECVQNYSRSQVWKVLQKVEQYFKDLQIDEQLAHRGRQVQQFEHMQREAYVAWQASKGHVVTITEVDGDHPTVTRKTEVSNGNPAYSTMYFNAMKGIADLLGIQAPKQAELKIAHAEEIPELPPMNSFSSRAEALEAVAKILQEKADAAKAASQ